MKNKEIDCPCTSGKKYAECCKPFHQGLLPDTAIKLMRSRYSAYALCLSDYIIHTTHPESPTFNTDKIRWSKEISEFCRGTEFAKLEILQSEEKDVFATVTFVAYLYQNKIDVSFTEKSYFQKVNGKWLYHSGQIS